MRNRTRSLAVATVTMLVLVGCTNTDTPTQPVITVIDTPASTVTTPTSVISTSSPTPTPTPPYDQKLAQEAMTVNERQNWLEGQYFKEGGWPKGLAVPDDLLAVMMETGLEKTLDVIHQTYESGVKYQSGELSLTDVKVVGVPAHNGSLIALRACRDGSKVRNKRKDGSTSTGAVIIHTSYYKRDTDGKLKMSHWTGKRVETCGG